MQKSVIDINIKNLLKQIAAKTLNEGVLDKGNFKCIFLSGLPGSGKSYVANDLFGVQFNTSNYGLRVVNSDYPFVKYLQKSNLPQDRRHGFVDAQTDSKIDVQFNKAKQTMNKQLQLYIEARKGIIIDLTGASFQGVKNRKAMAEANGYDTMMIYVMTSLETALYRNTLRDRKVPEYVIYDTYAQLRKNISIYKSLFGKNFIQIVNQIGTSIDSKIKKKVNDFISSQPTNYLAKQWIDLQLKKRNITK